MNLVDFPNVYTDEQSAILRRWGVQVPERAPARHEELGDFMKVCIPDGWKVRPYAHHYLYQELVDCRGFVRAVIFAKTRFLDTRICVQHVHRALEFDCVNLTDLPPMPGVGDYSRCSYPPVRWQLRLGGRWVVAEGAIQPYGSNGDIDMSAYPGWDEYHTWWDMEIPAGAVRINFC